MSALVHVAPAKPLALHANGSNPVCGSNYLRAYLKEVSSPAGQQREFRRHPANTRGCGTLQIRLRNWVTKNNGAVWAIEQANAYYRQAVEAYRK